MARRLGGAPNRGARPAPTRPGGANRRPRRGPSRAPAWTVPLLLSLLGLAILLLGLQRDCLDLNDSIPGSPGGQVCTTTPALGAVVFAVICWAAAVFVWLVGRRR